MIKFDDVFFVTSSEEPARWTTQVCFVSLSVCEIKINLFPLCLNTINNRIGNSSN